MSRYVLAAFNNATSNATQKRVNHMTSIAENFANAIAARISHERETACDASIKLLEKAQAVFTSAKFAEFAEASKLDHSFILHNANAAKKRDMKAIARAAEYMQFAMSTIAFIKTKSAANVLLTAFNCRKAEKTFTRDHAQLSVTNTKDETVKHIVSKLKNDLKQIVCSDTFVKANVRQSSMSLLALTDLNILVEKTKNVFEFADSEIAKATLAHLEANSK
jgi:hypothetical protein